MLWYYDTSRNELMKEASEKCASPDQDFVQMLPTPSRQHSSQSLSLLLTRKKLEGDVKSLRPSSSTIADTPSTYLHGVFRKQLHLYIFDVARILRSLGEPFEHKPETTSAGSSHNRLQGKVINT